MDQSILIIGAGAAGLMSALECSSAGLPVTVLEASAQPGGRIHTIELSTSAPGTPFSQDPAQASPGLSMPPNSPVSYIESGAEFIHGHLPVTLALLDQAGITYTPIAGQMIRMSKGRRLDEDFFGEEWETLMQKMEELEKDIPIKEFLDTRFPGEEYASLRENIRRFAEGYDLADIEKASTKALHEEWQEEGGTEYRVDGGYGKMIAYMQQRSEAQGAKFIFSSPVTRVDWEKGKVIATTAGGETFEATRLITTVSLGILAQDPPSIIFQPAIPDRIEAARQMGFGSVIKILVLFKSNWWKNKEGVGEFGFMLSDEKIPTWWAQAPSEKPLLSGWLAATAMKKFQVLDQAARIDACLESIASIFSVGKDFLREELITIQIFDWSQAPYIRGGYSYETVGCANARKILSTPVDQTLYFAGEALYEGHSMATVEAALTSGRDIAHIITQTESEP